MHTVLHPPQGMRFKAGELSSDAKFYFAVMAGCRIEFAFEEGPGFRMQLKTRIPADVQSIGGKIVVTMKE